MFTGQVVSYQNPDTQLDRSNSNMIQIIIDNISYNPFNNQILFNMLSRIRFCLRRFD